MPQRYSDDEEAAYELSHLLESDEHGDSSDNQERGPTSATQLPHELNEQAQSSIRSNTDFLDGLRGLAAVWVFVQHFMPAFTGGAHENGFGQDGTHFFVSLPYVRLFFGSGGNSAVVIFFVLSGYVLSISPLRTLKQQKPEEMRKTLVGALIRRPIRLYVPPLTISFLHALLLHVPGLFLPVPWLQPDERSVWKEIGFWWEKLDYFSPLREHGSHLFAYPYNVAMWTLPIELKGSLLVYATLAILSLGLQGPDPKAPTMVAVIIFFAGAIMLQHFWKWSMVCFLFGMMLALLDTWPIGDELRNLFNRPAWLKVPTGFAERTLMWTKGRPGWVRGVIQWRNGAWERWETVTKSKVLPIWLRRRLQRRAPRPQSRVKRSTFFPHACFIVGFYLLSEPSHAGDRNFSLNALGWEWLTKMIPEQYDDLRYYRYWQTWGALLGIYSVLRISWLQWFFTTRVLKFFGFVSFMLYLVHLPFFRIFPDRFNNLIGFNGDPNDFGTFWDKTWEFPDFGPVGMTSRFWVSLAVCFPTTLFVAWVATVTIDQPSVKLGKLITRLIGLDRAKAKPVAQSQVAGTVNVLQSTTEYSDKETEGSELDEAASLAEREARHT